VSIEVRFSSLSKLVEDLRNMGATNILNSRSRTPISRYGFAAAAADFSAAGDADGKTTERFEIIYLTGWAPAPSQPKPARRGSATASLSAALQAKR
jgi:hypothetical protein